MKNFSHPVRHRGIVLPEQRKLNFRSTYSLLVRRKRIQQGVGFILLAVIGLGSWFVAAQ